MTPKAAARNRDLSKTSIEKIIDDDIWKTALRLNMSVSDVGSRYVLNEMFDSNSARLREVLGEARFKELAGITAYVNSMMLDFESALPYALMENKKESLIQLQENSILYGRSGVVSALDELGRKDNITELIMNTDDMQNFLVYHALPQVRLCRKRSDSPVYELEPKPLEELLDKITIDRKDALSLALELLEEKGNRNIPRKLIFSKLIEDKSRMDKYKNELREIYLTPRDTIDSSVKQRALFLDEGTVSRMQFGDDNPVFPVASNIFLVDKNGSKKVWKEDLKLYTDFSCLDGYSSEKEILEGLDHPNIIKLLGAFTEKNMDFLELEYAPGKPLDSYDDLSEKEILGITIALCGTLDYMHRNDVVYMDMKKKNVMYDRPKSSEISDKSYGLEAIAKNIKLLDFGMSRRSEGLNSSTTLTTLLSTPEYLTPELTGFRSCIATDTFQMGLLLHSMLYKKHAFADESLVLKTGDEFRESEILKYGLAVKYGKYSPIDDVYGAILSGMLEKDPAARPDISYVKSALKDIYDVKFGPESSKSSGTSVHDVPSTGISVREVVS